MDAIYLTNSQIEKYNKTGHLILSKNVFKTPNVKFKLNKNQVTKLKNGEKIEITNKNGGFIPIVPLVAGLTGLVSAGTSIYNSIQNKKANDKLIEEKKRQNNILEKQNKEGKPLIINSLRTEAENLKGGALTLKKEINKHKVGNGFNMDLLIKASKKKYK